MAEVRIAGHHFKRWQVISVALGGAGIAAFIFWKHQSGTSSAGTAATVTDPSTGTQYPASGVDPMTGLTYSAEISQYGSVSAAEAAVSSGASYNSGAYNSNLSGYGTSYGPVGTGTTTLGTTSGGGYASNADWDQAATAGLSSIGYSTTDVSAALGRYLGGLSLTPDQQNIVNVALGEFGPPPSGSLPIIAAPATGTATSGDTGTSSSTGTTSSTGTSSTGTSTGTSSSTSAAKSTVSGGHVVRVSNNDAVIAWNHAGPATQWKVTRVGPGGTVSNTVGVPQASYSGLSAGHNYEVTVQPLPTGQSGVITFKTTATK